MRNTVILLSLGALLAACQPAGQVANGKVVSVGKTNLVLKDADYVMFLPIQKIDREQLKLLKKGDDVTLIGNSASDDGKGVDVEEIVLSDGTHIPVGQE